MTDSKNIPELRFPGFTGEWEEKKLGEVFEFIKSYSYSRNDEGDGEYLHIHYGDIHSKYSSVIDDNTEIPSIKNLTEHIKLENLDIVLADASEDYNDLGKAILLKHRNSRKIIAGLHTFALRAKNKKYINPKYFLYYTKTDMYKKYMAKVGTGTSVFGINKKTLELLSIPLSNINEQEKISSFFYTLDQKLDLQKKKIEELKSYKKGMMQRIFSQEIRFKDDNGRNYPDWEEKKLGDSIINIVEKVKNQNIPILSSTSKGIFLQSEYFKTSVASKDISDYKVVKKGDFTYRSMSDTGEFYFNIQNIVDMGAVSPAYPVFNFKDNINNMWFYYFVNNSNSIKRQLLGIFQGGTRFSLPISKFRLLKINLPSLPEQEKIASFLSAIDKKIELEEERLEAFEKFKKGLMQRMFV